jgi:hypothetical protein
MPEELARASSPKSFGNSLAMSCELLRLAKGLSAPLSLKEGLYRVRRTNLKEQTRKSSPVDLASNVPVGSLRRVLKKRALNLRRPALSVHDLANSNVMKNGQIDVSDYQSEWKEVR